MEKISSILPANPRLKSVDVEDAHPVRPGVPSMGRPVGRVSSQDRFSVSQQAKDLAFQETLAVKNPREDRQVKMVDEMTRKFFEQKVNPRTDQTRITPEPEEIQEVEDVGSAETQVQTMNPVKGSRIDTVA